MAGPLSNETDQNLLLTLRGYADVVLVGAGTVRAEGYGPVRLTTGQIADRNGAGAPRRSPDRGGYADRRHARIIVR